MILKVARMGNPVLRLKAGPVPVGQIRVPELQAFLGHLTETMHEYDGVGIAAPQVHVSLQIAVIEALHNPRYPKAPKIPLIVLINPKVKPVSTRRVSDWEGCLSVDSFRGKVPRWHSVEVQAYNRQGKLIRFRATGFCARVVQHEWDHLQGNVYLDRMPDLLTSTHLTEYSRYWVK